MMKRTLNIVLVSFVLIVVSASALAQTVEKPRFDERPPRPTATPDLRLDPFVPPFRWPRDCAKDPGENCLATPTPTLVFREDWHDDLPCVQYWQTAQITPGGAEDSPPPDETPGDNRPLLALALAGLLLAVIAALIVLRTSIVQLGASVPKIAYDPLNSALESLLKSVGEYVNKTPTQIDNAVLTELLDEIELIRREIENLRNAPRG